jgi:disulfide bond formation protein DsbB
MRIVVTIPVLLALSVIVIADVFFFQYVMGLVPCEICYVERWPWYAAVLITGGLLAFRPPALLPWAPALLILLFLASVAIGVYHVGVEQHIFAGPDACTGPTLHGNSIEELTRQLRATPAVRCDEPQWTLFGVSLAGWNVVVSGFALLLSIRAWLRGRR